MIRKNTSPCAIPVVLTPKKRGKWRMCIDSREINRITIRYRFPIPRIDYLIECLDRARYFSKIDLKCGCHYMKMKEAGE